MEAETTEVHRHWSRTRVQKSKQKSQEEDEGSKGRVYWWAMQEHGEGNAWTASPKPFFRAPWRVGNAVVDRGNAWLITSKSGHPSPYQNCWIGPPTEKTDKGSLPNPPSCPPNHPIGRGTELKWRSTHVHQSHSLGQGFIHSGSGNWDELSSVPWLTGWLGGHEGWFGRDPFLVFSVGGRCEQFWLRWDTHVSRMLCIHHYLWPWLVFDGGNWGILPRQKLYCGPFLRHCLRVIFLTLNACSLCWSLNSDADCILRSQWY